MLFPTFPESLTFLDCLPDRSIDRSFFAHAPQRLQRAENGNPDSGKKKGKDIVNLGDSSPLNIVGVPPLTTSAAFI